MFAIGFALILIGMGVGMKWGNPLRAYNWADWVALSGVVSGTVLCAASMVIWFWKVLP